MVISSFFAIAVFNLWSSDDPETVVEMTKFYRRWYLNPLLIPPNSGRAYETLDVDA